MSEPNKAFDDGMVVDAYVQLSLLGLNLITIDARVVSTNVRNSLRIAEAAGRRGQDEQRRGIRQPGLPEMLSQRIEAGARGETAGLPSQAAPEEAHTPPPDRRDGEARERRPPEFGLRVAAAPRRAPSDRLPLRRDPPGRRGGPP